MDKEKSSIEEIRQRFDADVERFSNLETGQSATIDAPLNLELVAQAAKSTCPKASHILDVGCGAGNYTLKFLDIGLKPKQITLIDLSQPMLDKSVERVQSASNAEIKTIQEDIGSLSLPENTYDIIVAAAVLHHLRTDTDWETVFHMIYKSLRPGGSFWISDLIIHDHLAIQGLMWKRYGEYLVSLKDENYRNEVFDYIEKEDSPRSLNYQMDLLKKVGFKDIEVLHKNSVFAAFGAMK